MRVGVNPAKLDIDLGHPFTHRVLIPIYIPSLTEYHEHSLEVLEMCLLSLVRTVHDQTAISLINNNSCAEVSQFLEAFAREHAAVDQLVVNHRNTGKVDALFNLIRGCYEPLISISDADVLFVEGWQEECENAFVHYPELGFVCPTPIPDNHFYFTASSWYWAWKKGANRMQNIPEPQDLERFATSIGKSGEQLEELMRRNQQKMFYQYGSGPELVLGAGHFVACIRREALWSAPHELSGKRILGNSELRFIDQPVDQLGLVRASLPKARAFHMGNVPEPWMREEMPKADSKPTAVAIPALQKAKGSYWWRRKLIRWAKKKYASLR